MGIYIEWNTVYYDDYAYMYIMHDALWGTVQLFLFDLATTISRYLLKQCPHRVPSLNIKE